MRRPKPSVSGTFMAADPQRYLGESLSSASSPPRVFFAGEGTHGQHPATATGAFLSGVREAQRIDERARTGFPPLGF